MKPQKKSVSITIYVDILEKLKRFEEKDNCSLSQYINVVVRDYIAQKDLLRNVKD